MKKLFKLLIYLTMLHDISLKSVTLEELQNCDVDFAVIGDGPAGICTVSVMLDLGLLPERIMWIGPEFNVGRLATYSNVPANTKNKDFIEFLKSCKTFLECSSTEINLNNLDPEKEYPLESVVKPLKSITDCLLQQVNSIKGNLESLYFEDNSWNIIANGQKVKAYNVVLATGSHPKTLDYPELKNKEIPLDIALDKYKLEQILKPEDEIAVVGSCHSAILLLKYLSEINVKKIINFYNKPIVYATEIENWTLNSHNGIKGVAAKWAKEILEKNPPANLTRVPSTNENLKELLPKCTKIVYAIGFEKNQLPYIKENPDLSYDSSTGVIAPRLFGIGIAFPGQVINPLGQAELHVGLDSFMEHAQKVVPCWMQIRSLKLPGKKHIEFLNKFNDLFMIQIL